MARLGDICTKGSSSIKQSDLDSRNGIYPIYGASGFIKNVDFYEQEKPYVAVVKDGAGIGRVMQLPAKSSVIGTMQYILPNDGINVSYLAYAMESMNLAKYYTGATIPHIYFKNYSGEMIPAHSEQEQRHIAAVLDKVSELIALRKQQLAKLDELVKARFVEMFGDPVANEKRWPIASIGEVAEVKIGPFGSLLHKEDYIEGIHALVNPSHIVDDKICVDNKLSVTREKYEELSAYHLMPGDVVLGRRGEMGRCAVVYREGLLCGTGSMILRVDGRIIRPYFLQAILSSPTYKRYIEDKAVGVTMQNLNVPIVSSLLIPLYPPEKQVEYINLLYHTDMEKNTIRKSIRALETLKSALMQEYFG